MKNKNKFIFYNNSVLIVVPCVCIYIHHTTMVVLKFSYMFVCTHNAKNKTYTNDFTLGNMIHSVIVIII